MDWEAAAADWAVADSEAVGQAVAATEEVGQAVAATEEAGWAAAGWVAEAEAEKATEEAVATGTRLGWTRALKSCTWSLGSRMLSGSESQCMQPAR